MSDTIDLELTVERRLDALEHLEKIGLNLFLVFHLLTIPKDRGVFT